MLWSMSCAGGPLLCVATASVAVGSVGIMDQHARAAEGSAPRNEDVAIPTIRRVVLRTLPAAAITVSGIPVIAWLLVDATSGMTTRWLPVLIIALVGLATLVHHFVQAPRPSFDKRVSTREVKDALSYTHKVGTVPTDPHVRTAAGVFACSDVETIMMVGAFLLGGALAALIRPEFPWLSTGFALVAIVLIIAFKARHGWSYLKVLHSESRTG